MERDLNRDIDDLRKEVDNLKELLSNIPKLYHKQNKELIKIAQKKQNLEICPRKTQLINNDEASIRHNWVIMGYEEVCLDCRVKRINKIYDN